jgi:hypothetical protein
MNTQAQSSSQHLAAARELLEELAPVMQTPEGGPQTKAIAAVAHSTRVLAEQVAVVRVLMASGAVAKRSNGEQAPRL